MRNIVIMLLLSMTTVGCFRAQTAAPADKNLIIASKSDICHEMDSRKVFSFFGVANYNDDTSLSLLADVPNGKKVRIKTKLGFWDMVVSNLTFGLLCMHTISAEVCQ